MVLTVHLRRKDLTSNVPRWGNDIFVSTFAIWVWHGPKFAIAL